MDDNAKKEEILAFLQKRKARTDEEILAERRAARGSGNAVEVTVRHYPSPITVETFPTGYGLLEPDSMILSAKTGFPVACYSAWRSEDGSTNRLISRFYSGRRNVSGTCLLFGWKDGAPAPFTAQEAEIVCEILAEARLKLDRGQ